MQIIILPDTHAIAAIAADAIEQLLRSKEHPVLGVATGSTPLPVYDELARRHREEGLDFTTTQAFALDEYVGLPKNHPESYARVLNREFTAKVGMDPSRIHVPDGSAHDPATACRRFEQAIAAAGGVDIQLLGIGTDGHLGFNEPSSSLTSRTRIKTLTDRTRADNSRFFGSPDQVPRHVLTQGLGTILEARHNILIATGEHKAQAVRDLVEGPVSARCPASVLQLHTNTTVLLDTAAASRLELSDYYRQVYAHKP